MKICIRVLCQNDTKLSIVDWTTLNKPSALSERQYTVQASIEQGLIYDFSQSVNL